MWWCWIKIWANFLPWLLLAQIANPLIKKHTQWNSSILVISNMIWVYTFTHLGSYSVGTIRLVSNLAKAWHAIKVLWTNSFHTWFFYLFSWVPMHSLHLMVHCFWKLTWAWNQHVPKNFTMGMKVVTNNSKTRMHPTIRVKKWSMGNWKMDVVYKFDHYG